MRTFMGPKVVISIFQVVNINLEGILWVRKIKKILSYHEDSRCPYPLSFAHSNGVPIDYRDATPIATIRPKNFRAIWDNLFNIELGTR